jgi:hypothetical protein
MKNGSSDDGVHTWGELFTVVSGNNRKETCFGHRCETKKDRTSARFGLRQRQWEPVQLSDYFWITSSFWMTLFWTTSPFSM